MHTQTHFTGTYNSNENMNKFCKCLTTAINFFNIEIYIRNTKSFLFLNNLNSERRESVNSSAKTNAIKLRNILIYAKNLRRICRSYFSKMVIIWCIVRPKMTIIWSKQCSFVLSSEACAMDVGQLFFDAQHAAISKISALVWSRIHVFYVQWDLFLEIPKRRLPNTIEKKILPKRATEKWECKHLFIFAFW